MDKDGLCWCSEAIPLTQSFTKCLLSGCCVQARIRALGFRENRTDKPTLSCWGRGPTINNKRIHGWRNLGQVP